MPQFRLTQKFANDIKVNILSEPKLIPNILDDWAIDRLIIKRKKVAMVTHVKSLLTFLISYKEIGGAINVLEGIGVLLSQWLYDRDLILLGDKAIELFNDNQQKNFCKTIDRKLLGHMNDFKRCINVCVNHPYYDEIDFDDISDKINDTIVSAIKNNYDNPKGLMLKLIEKNDNLIILN